MKEILNYHQTTKKKKTWNQIMDNQYNQSKVLNLNTNFPSRILNQYNLKCPIESSLFPFNFPQKFKKTSRQLFHLPSKNIKIFQFSKNAPSRIFP